MKTKVELNKSELTQLVYLAQVNGYQKLADKLKIAFVDAQIATENARVETYREE